MPVSLNSTLSTARSALMANQAAMQVVSDNIANANTEGYTRKRASLGTGPAQVLPEGVFGTGVVVRDVTQQRDRFLDAAYRDASSSRQQQQVRYEYLGQIESAFGEPDSGLFNTLDAFWNSWSDLANDPLNDSARAVIRERGIQLVSQVHRLSSSLASIEESAVRRLEAEVGQVNALTGRIAQLNEQIVAAEAGGHTAGQLRDERDLAVDQLAGMASVQVMERSNGGIAVAFEGLTLVDGGGHQELAAPKPEGGKYVLATANGAPLAPSGGSLAGYLEILNTDIPHFRDQLNTLVSNLVEAVNTEHSAGVNPDHTQVNFFATVEDLKTAASSFALSDEVATSASAIAAGTGSPVTGSYASGRNDVANKLAALRTSDGITKFYNGFVADIGLRTRSASDNARAQAILAGQAANLRDSFMGVSTDEEMVDLIRLQKSYSAAARVVTVADEMMQTLLDMKR